jgi:hypothetical protein
MPYLCVEMKKYSISAEWGAESPDSTVPQQLHRAKIAARTANSCRVEPVNILRQHGGR